ncbi:alpha-ketoglutarate-dependent dioxygenase alkB homolog 4 [Orussus abietinus]|uniref:alpha-ketoglutarate-dependent dioxygenase alkB homolog 4 n=1 Tax=Orussus abietinus TaxID=222816 RepID=UPI0006269E65|nr:alpha-ketoglutarate-dependent dioxygenase alkB homolog 4 [Orussus abietinus]
MDTVRICGCKGVRTCLVCELKYNILKPDLLQELKNKTCYVYCPYCDKAWPGWDIELYKKHPDHVGEAIDFPGVYIKLNFLTDNEADQLIKDLDESSWEPSQSGRRKQNYGPKCNFKKRRIQLGSFAGFPKCTKFVQDKFLTTPLLEDFKTIEQCSLEYDPNRGASIDPHIDDCWIWGERIVTVNVLSDSVLTMIPYNGPVTRYNLIDITKYSPVVKCANDVKFHDIQDMGQEIVRIPMPAKSLILLYNAARYNWEHTVLREDIRSRRVCLAYREFTPPYLPGGDRIDASNEILNKSTVFW